MDRRQVVTALLIVQLVSAILLALGQAMNDIREPAFVIALAAAVISGVLLAAYRRGWEAACGVNIIITTIAVGMGTPDQFVRQLTALIVLTPPAIAQVLGGPRWIAGSALGVLVILSLRAGPEAGFLTAYTNDLRTFVSLLIIVLGMILSRMIADRALQTATIHARQADEALERAESQSAALRAQTDTLNAQNQRQQKLLSLVETLETPAITLAEGVLLAPVVGSLDDRRANAFMARVLQQSEAQRANLVIIDITAATNVDEQAALGLARTAASLRLLGCRVAISGISAELARTLAINQISLGDARTVQTPREALEAFQQG